jgi:hypothetical protein
MSNHSGATQAKIERSLLKTVGTDRRLQRWFHVIWLG